MTRTVCSMLAIWLVLGTSAGLAAPHQHEAVTVPTGPALTGDISDPLCQKAARAPAFVGADGLTAPKAPTETYLLADAEAGAYLPTERAVAGRSYGAIPASTPVGPEGGRDLARWSVDAVNALWEE